MTNEASLLKYNKFFMNNRAVIEENSPTSINPNSASDKLNCIKSLNCNGDETKSISWAAKLAEIEASEIAVNARIEKCLNTTSWENTMPAIGELKPAEIAAATPAPIMTSCGIWGMKVRRLRNAPKVPPKWTNGP